MCKPIKRTCTLATRHLSAIVTMQSYSAIESLMSAKRETATAASAMFEFESAQEQGIIEILDRQPDSFHNKV